MNCAVFILTSIGRKQWSVWPVAGPSPRRGWVYCALCTVQWDFGNMKHPVILSHCAESLKLESLSTEFWREKIYLLGNSFPFKNIHLYTFTQVHILTCAHVHQCVCTPVHLQVSAPVQLLLRRAPSVSLVLAKHGPVAEGTSLKIHCKVGKFCSFSYSYSHSCSSQCSSSMTRHHPHPPPGHRLPG